MALAIDGSSPALATITNTGTTVTTASFTPPAGSQLWCGGVINGSATGSTMTIASTPTLGAFSQRLITNTQEAPSAWWVVSVVTSQAYTVTLTRTDNTNRGMALYVRVITGAETTAAGATATNNSNSGAPSQSITTTRDNSMILAAVGDWAQAGNATAGTSQTILAEQNLAGDYSVHFWRRDSTVTVGSYTINLTAPSTQDYNLSIVEIREPAATYAPNQSRYPAQAVRRAANF